MGPVGTGKTSTAIRFEEMREEEGTERNRLKRLKRNGAGGGIRTHGGLRQRILSPPPCLRLLRFLAAYLDLARVPPHNILKKA